MEEIFLSVIIPTCNRNEMLEICLMSLHPENQNLDKNNYEVIISDDSKSNIARELVQAKFPWVKWVEGSKKGPAANRNRGAKNATGNWLIFTDDDCIPSPGWLMAYYNAIQTESNQFKVFEGLTKANRPKLRFDEEAPINLDGGKMWSCNFAIQKKAFEVIGGFDESFLFYMEDADFYTRISESEKIKFLQAAEVVHPWRKVKPFKNYKKILSAKKQFFRKHGQNHFGDRIKRFKNFIGVFFKFTKELFKYSFKGASVYVEQLWYRFIIIFL